MPLTSHLPPITSHLLPITDHRSPSPRYDVSLFLVIFSTVALGFGLTFIALMSMEAPHSLRHVARWQPIFGPAGEQTIANMLSGDTDEGWTSLSSLAVPFWAALGEPSLPHVEQSSPVYGPVLLWVYVMVSQVLLVNLLIAMMGNTYQKYALNAEKEFYFNKVTVAIESRALFVVPAPLSLPLLLAPSAWCVAPDVVDYGNGMAELKAELHSSDLQDVLLSVERYVAKDTADRERSVPLQVGQDLDPTERGA